MFRPVRWALILLAASLVPAALAQVADDPVGSELERVTDLYRAIVSYHVLLQGDGVTKEMVTSAIHDVEKYVEELDNRYATAQLFIKDQKALDDIKYTVAKAHFEASLLHARGVDLEGSIVQYEEVIELLGMDPVDWQEDLVRSAKPGLLPGAMEIAYQTAAPRDLVEDLKLFWSSGVVTRFNVREYAPSQLASLKMERIGGRTDPFSEASFQLAAGRFAERTSSGLETFRVVLPPGYYRVSSTDPTIHPLEFQLTQGGVPDPVVLNPNSFSFAFGAQDDKCRPVVTLNGLPIKNFGAIPYGTYRLKAPATCAKRLPDKITVDQNAEVTLRTEPEKLDYVKEGQPIFLFITTPPGSTYTLRM
ncbi:MAG: hypothetical protein KBD01_07325 [Acidobacteria bacterium]|nr:hypothetical protein [Acidobacteriota bacterium]